MQVHMGDRTQDGATGMSVNPATMAYLAALGGVTIALLRLLPARREWRYASASPAIEQHDTLTVLRAESFTGENVIVPATVTLAPREEREYDDIAYRRILWEFDAAMAVELDRFNDALEPVRETLSAWHREGRHGCQQCERITAAVAACHLAGALSLRVPYAGV
jgi:hypothetical protein